MRDFRQRIRLVHELRELAGAKELSNCGHHRFRVYQVVRHSRGHLLVHGHLFLDGALHTYQTDAELILEQLAYCAHASVTQMVDIVDGSEPPAQFQQIKNRVDEIFLIKRALVERRYIGLVVQLNVELHATHAREIVLARVKEHTLEQLCRRVQGRRIARTQLAIDLK